MKIQDIQLAVCEEFGIKLAELLSKSRKREWAWPRHVAMGLSRELTDSSLTQIAKTFRKKDHTTVIHGINNYKRLLEDEEWAVQIYNVERELRNV